ncbi:MAG: Asp-tRNA(Asn)/Glu-tRNA(Gln) amidotransferase subunit GatC [Phycisphaerales bacterium JB040]
MSDALTPEDVKKIARLARLEVPEGELERVGRDLSAILGYAERLQGLDLDGVEPMAHVGDQSNRLDADEPGEAFSNETVMGLAPDGLEPFLRVPRVLGDGGGA